MNHYKNILCITLLLAICHARKKNPPLYQFEGPWTIRNASENALPIIGNCPTMKIEPLQKDSSSEGVVFFKSSIQTFTLTVVDVDQEIYQLFYPSDSESALLGNISLLHAEKSAFLITELQTEGQIYYAVLTKENQTSPDTNKKIDKIWKSSKPAKQVSLAPIEYGNCPKYPQEVTNSESHESTIYLMTKTTEIEQKELSESSDGSTLMNTTEKISNGEAKDTSMKSTSDHQHPWVEEVTSTPDINGRTTDSATNISKSTPFSTLSSNSTPKPTQTFTDKTKTLPIVGGNDTIKKTKLRNSADSNIYSSNSFITISLLGFLIIKTLVI